LFASARHPILDQDQREWERFDILLVLYRTDPGMK
jgi:hypothetical protein